MDEVFETPTRMAVATRLAPVVARSPDRATDLTDRSPSPRAAPRYGRPFGRPSGGVRRPDHNQAPREARRLNRAGDSSN